MTYNAAIQKLFDAGQMPMQIRSLPTDPRGYPIPWFVAQLADGSYDFRVVRPRGVEVALGRRICWICGRGLGDVFVFAVGPMCTINQVTSEPPAHADCARFAVRACPFLTNPKMRRNTKDIPSDARDPAGVMIKRNPGATALYYTRRFKGREGLIKLGKPFRIEWWAEGQPATRDQVLASIDSGMPILRAECDKDSNPDESHAALTTMYEKALKWVPSEAAA